MSLRHSGVSAAICDDSLAANKRRIVRGQEDDGLCDVVGLSEGDAKAALEAAGFTVNSDLVVGLGSVPGDVVAQDPVGGTRLRKGDEVVIKVAVF